MTISLLAQSTMKANSDFSHNDSARRGTQQSCKVNFTGRYKKLWLDFWWTFARCCVAQDGIRCTSWTAQKSSCHAVNEFSMSKYDLIAANVFLTLLGRCFERSKHFKFSPSRFLRADLLARVGLLSERGKRRHVKVTSNEVIRSLLYFVLLMIWNLVWNVTFSLTERRVARQNFVKTNSKFSNRVINFYLAAAPFYVLPTQMFELDRSRRISKRRIKLNFAENRKTLLMFGKKTSRRRIIWSNRVKISSSCARCELNARETRIMSSWGSWSRFKHVFFFITFLSFQLHVIFLLLNWIKRENRWEK